MINLFEKFIKEQQLKKYISVHFFLCPRGHETDEIKIK